MSYDAEGELLGYNVAASGSVSYSYSTRGELVGMSGAGTNSSSITYADGMGALGKSPNYGCYQGRFGTSCLYAEYDQRNAAPLGLVCAPLQLNGCTNSPITYDSEGRQSSSQLGFDVLSRVVQNAFSQGSGQNTEQYVWGPNGHPLLSTFNSLPQQTQHWLSGSVLFTSAANNSPDDTKLSSFGDYIQGQVLNEPFVIDRDPMGMSASNRESYNGSYASSAWVVPNPYASCSDGQMGNLGSLATPNPGYSAPPPTNCSPQGLLYQSRPDSYWDGVTDIHGVRTYEAGVNAWASPDAMPGSLADPLSQLPYAYARNNPVSYRDATGFCQSGYLSGALWVIGCVNNHPCTDVFCGGAGDEDAADMADALSPGDTGYYKSFPCLVLAACNATIYFNVNHFWNRHLACYLKSTQTQFIDQTTADIQQHFNGGQYPPYAVSESFQFVFNDLGAAYDLIEYRLYHFPYTTDFIVGTAFIPGLDDCP